MADQRLMICSILAVGLATSIRPSIALEFPRTYITPSATVTQISGVDTRNARMEGSYTLPDIIEACHEGYVDQADLAPNICIERHTKLTEAPPLHANADCVAGIIIVEGLRTKLPAREDCASGGMRAIAAFKSLCPSYGGELKLKD
jgi:hypothetical protein